MINNIELAKSDRSKCVECDEKIFKDEPRGIRISGGFYCFDCSKKIIKSQINTSKRLQNKLKKMVKNKLKKIILNRLN